MNERINTLKSKAKEIIAIGKKYWNVPPKGNYVPYKEVATLGAAGFGVQWTPILAGTIGLDAGNFLVGHSIGLAPMDLYIMLIVSNAIGIPIGLFRGWYFDNHHMKGGKFIPFMLRTAFPIVGISTLFVFLPFEHWEYTVKAVVTFFFYLILQFFLCFYNEGFAYLQQIITPNAQERATVMSISQIIYSLAPSISNFLIPTVAGLTYGLNNIQTYRTIYPAFAFVGLIVNTIFFRKVKERLILPKSGGASVRIIDALREVAKNKYFWITTSASWVGFLENSYGIVLSWSFVYAYGGKYEATLGVVNTIIGNAALWSMIIAPILISKIGKRNMLIMCNILNIVLLGFLYFGYQNLIFVSVIFFMNNFINVFGNIYFPNIQADMRDYHQWKTGVRVDGMFGPLGMISTVLGFFTGLIIPSIYEHMGLHDDYSVLYGDEMRNNLFHVIIICAVIGAFLNLIPYLFYDLTENKHNGYVLVLKIRAMFEDYANGDISDDEIEEGMEIIHRAGELNGAKKTDIDRSALKAAKRLPKKTDGEKAERKERIKAAKKEIKAQLKFNNDIESYAFVSEEMAKFSSDSFRVLLDNAKKTYENGTLQRYDDIDFERGQAKAMPKNNDEQKKARADMFEVVRTKKTARKLIEKYGIENIKMPDEAIREEIQNRETPTMGESMKAKRDLKAFLKAKSIYERATAPYEKARRLLAQAENYTHLDELDALYAQIIAKRQAETV